MDNLLTQDTMSDPNMVAYTVICTAYVQCTWSESIVTSCKMESIGRLLSLPLVNGTMQKLHMFSHPRMMELVEGGRVGERDGEVGKRGREERGGVERKERTEREKYG